MCSTTAARIDRICRAIEELAGRAGQHGDQVPSSEEATGSGARRAAETGRRSRAGGAGAMACTDGAGGSADPGKTTGNDQAESTGTSAAGGDVADGLAAIWTMIAEVDPEMAKRLSGYLTAAE